METHKEVKEGITGRDSGVARERGLGYKSYCESPPGWPDAQACWRRRRERRANGPMGKGLS